MNATIKPELSREVAEALSAREPVVALESTIISHGMPYPDNVQTALEACDLVRRGGAVPAVTAVIDGRLKAGLSEADIDLLGRSTEVLKVSRRDLAYAVSRGATGATTVSSTMCIAHGAGIRVFATGGIGGVHRPAESSPGRPPFSFDVSADLTEFARTPVAVVSAGAKAILDLAATLEVLETVGVPVVGYGTDEFPAFYSRSSGLPVPMRVDTPREAAEMIETQRSLGLRQGILFANPVPRDKEIPTEQMQALVDRAVGDMEKEGISGREVTPFLLSRIVELTDGSALRTNIDLFMNNVGLGTEIALALTGITGHGS